MVYDIKEATHLIFVQRFGTDSRQFFLAINALQFFLRWISIMFCQMSKVRAIIDNTAKKKCIEFLIFLSGGRIFVI